MEKKQHFAIFFQILEVKFSKCLRSQDKVQERC